MKKNLLAILLFILPAFAMADPPKKVTLTYNQESKKLKVVALHPVKDVEEHFIDEIVISVDGNEVKKLKLKKQSNAKTEEIELAIPEIKKGSEISVKARCNEFGSKTETLKL